MTAVSRPARTALFLAGLCLAGLAPVRAQPADVPEVEEGEEGEDAPDPQEGFPVYFEEVRIGFQREHTPAGGFVPVNVILKSLDVARRVEVSLRSAESGAVLLDLGWQELDPGSPRRVQTLAPVKVLNEVGKLMAVAETEAGAIAGRVPAYADQSKNRFLLVLDRRGAGPADLSGLGTLRARGGGKKKKGRGDQWSPCWLASLSELPGSSLAYTSARAVLLGDLELERWDPTQAQALAGWVARGGHLVVSIGGRGDLLKKSALGKALGVALDPLPFDRPPIPGSKVTVAGLLGQFGPLDELPTTRPPYTAALQPGPGDTVLYRDDRRPRGRPLVLRRRHGQGLITLVACDLWAAPFDRQRHTARLLQVLLDNAPVYRPRARILFEKLAEVRQPAQIGPAFALLIIYALLAGPGIYFLLRAKKRGIFLWVVIPGLTLGFTLLVPFYRLVLKDAESTIVGVRLIEARAGDPLAVETLDALLFSGSLEEKRLSLRGEDAVAFSVVPQLRRRGRRVPNLGGVLGSATGEELSFPLPVALWGARYVSFERTHQAPRLGGSVELESGQDAERLVRLRADYAAGFPLRDAIIVYPDKGAALVYGLEGPLAPGDSLDLTLSTIGPHNRSGSLPSENSLGKIMIERVLNSLLREQVEEQGRAFLVARTDAPPPLHAEPNVRVRAFTTVIAVELPVSYRDGIPFGVVRELREAATVAEVDSSSLSRRITSRFALPGARRPASKLSVRLRAPRGVLLRPENLALRGLAHRGEQPAWEPISTAPADASTDRSGRVMTLSLREPDLWISPDGEVALAQDFDRPRIESDEHFSVLIDIAVEWEGSSGPPPRVEEPDEPDDDEDPGER